MGTVAPPVGSPPLARLFAIGYRQLIDGLHDRLHDRGWTDIRPAYGFVLLAVGHQQSFRRSPLDTSPFTGNHAAVRWHGVGGTGWKSAAIPRRREHVPSRQ